MDNVRVCYVFINFVFVKSFIIFLDQKASGLKSLIALLPPYSRELTEIMTDKRQVKKATSRINKNANLMSDKETKASLKIIINLILLKVILYKLKMS